MVPLCWEPWNLMIPLCWDYRVVTEEPWPRDPSVLGTLGTIGWGLRLDGCPGATSISTNINLEWQFHPEFCCYANKGTLSFTSYPQPICKIGSRSISVDSFIMKHSWQVIAQRKWKKYFICDSGELNMCDKLSQQQCLEVERIRRSIGYLPLDELLCRTGRIASTTTQTRHLQNPNINPWSSGYISTCCIFKLTTLKWQLFQMTNETDQTPLKLERWPSNNSFKNASVNNVTFNAIN